MKNIKKNKTYTSKLIDDLTSEISPKEQKKTDRKMMLAARIDEAMKVKGIKKGQLAKSLNKLPSEITKWLSGTHNFTVETLWEICDKLGVELINLEETQKEQIVYYAIYNVSQRAATGNWETSMNKSVATFKNKQDFVLTSN